MTRGRKFRRKSRSNFEYLVSCRLLLSSRWYRRTGFKFVRRCCECVRGRLSPFDKRHVGIHTGAFLRLEKSTYDACVLDESNQRGFSFALASQMLAWFAKPATDCFATKSEFLDFRGSTTSVVRTKSLGSIFNHEYFESGLSTSDTMKRNIVGSCCIYNA